MRRILTFAALSLLPLHAHSHLTAATPTRPLPTSRPVSTIPSPRSTLKPIPVSNDHTLTLNVPDTWSYSIARSSPELPTAVKFTIEPRRFSFQLTAALPSEGNDATTLENLRELAQLIGQKHLVDAKETTLKLLDLKGPQTTALYYTLTDKSPGDSFPYITNVTAATGNILHGSTILHRQLNAPERQAALNLLQSATSSKSTPAPLRLPSTALNRRWTLVLPPGLDLIEERFDAIEKSRRLTAVNTDAGLVVTVFIEPPAKPGDALAARALYFGRMQKSPLKLTDIKQARLGEYATAQYMIAEHDGQRLDQRNLHLYASRDGLWIDIHLSKTEFTEQDQPLFDDFVKTVKFEPTPAKP